MTPIYVSTDDVIDHLGKKTEDDQSLDEKRSKMKRSRNDDEVTKRKQRVTKPYARSFGASGVGLPGQWRSEVNLASK